jgi:hypothetical protein
MATRKLGEALAMTRRAFMTTLRWACVIVALDPAARHMRRRDTIALLKIRPDSTGNQVQDRGTLTDLKAQRSRKGRPPFTGGSDAVVIDATTFTGLVMKQ